MWYEETFVKVEGLKPHLRRVNIVVKVVSKSPVRNVRSRYRYDSHRVCDALIGDETGCIYLTLWDDNIDQINVEDTLRIENGYVNLFRGSMRSNIGRYGSFEILEKSPIYEVNTANNLSDKQYEEERSYRRYRRSHWGSS